MLPDGLMTTWENPESQAETILTFIFNVIHFTTEILYNKVDTPHNVLIHGQELNFKPQETNDIE